MTKPGLTTLLALALTAAAASSDARDFPPEVEREASQVFGAVMSPFCPGKLIADCPSPAAMQLRESIRERVAAGESADGIRKELYDTYGEYLRAAPSGEGFDLLAWVVPPLLIAVSAGALLVWIRRRRTDAPVTTHAAEKLDSEAKARIEVELAKTDTD